MSNCPCSESRNFSPDPGSIIIWIMIGTHTHNGNIPTKHWYNWIHSKSYQNIYMSFISNKMKKLGAIVTPFIIRGSDQTTESIPRTLLTWSIKSRECQNWTGSSSIHSNKSLLQIKFEIECNKNWLTC